MRGKENISFFNELLYDSPVNYLNCLNLALIPFFICRRIFVSQAINMYFPGSWCLWLVTEKYTSNSGYLHIWVVWADTKLSFSSAVFPLWLHLCNSGHYSFLLRQGAICLFLLIQPSQSLKEHLEIINLLFNGWIVEAMIDWRSHSQSGKVLRMLLNASQCLFIHCHVSWRHWSLEIIIFFWYL